MPEAWHDKIRQLPYPKESNEIFINPAPLIVPQKMKTDAYLQFALSTDPKFKENAILSDKVVWCMFNPHRVLENGLWYWRFRSVGKDGKESEWSATYQFEITDKIPRFVTPSFKSFRNSMPAKHPRLFCFLDDDLEQARRSVTSHPEYKALLNRAASALKADYSTINNPYNKISEIKNYMEFLYQAYHLTQENIYADKMLELLRVLIAYPLTDKQLFDSNFGSTDIAICFIEAYDQLYDRLSAGEKTAAEELLIKIARYYYRSYCGMQENHIFDNHFWQHNMRVLFQSAFMLHDKNNYADEVLPMLEYYYELWTARAPDSGFNRDGIWRNGASYFNANIKTLYYMPSLFSYITGEDFLQHPWYQNAGQALAYIWPPESKSASSGDGTEKGDEPNRQRVGFADFLARETGDAYAGWYAGQCRNALIQDYDLRLYRMVSSKSYNTSLPAGTPKLVWYKDAGEVIVHSDLTHTGNNLTLSFRSSTFGSGSHTVANQNSFNLLYKGADVYRSSGYYQNFSDTHNLMSYRHTRAHNTLLVNGIGQPFSMKGYGNITRAMGGEHISYCTGDASHAYSGISDDPMWIENFEKAGITQTPENGFGATPLTKYLRHIFMLHPDIIVIYDELEAGEAVRWDWLLHGPVQFGINQAEKKITAVHTDKAFTAVAQLFSQREFSLAQTDRFVAPPTDNDPELYPSQWHLTAAFPACNTNRILTVVQIIPDGSTPQRIETENDTYRCGNWIIQAELSPSVPGSIHIKDTSSNAEFNYRAGEASGLYDRIDGKYQQQQMTDYRPASTRTTTY